jgi:hypothetical protein
VHDRRPVGADVAGGMGATSDKIPPRRTGTVTATRPSAATCLAFRDDQPMVGGLVQHAAGPGFAGWGDVAEHGERGIGDRPPHLLAGQPGLRLPVLFVDSPGSHDRLPVPALPGLPRSTLLPDRDRAPGSSGPRRGDLRPGKTRRGRADAGALGDRPNHGRQRPCHSLGLCSPATVAGRRPGRPARCLVKTSMEAVCRTAPPIAGHGRAERPKVPGPKRLSALKRGPTGA